MFLVEISLLTCTLFVYLVWLSKAVLSLSSLFWCLSCVVFLYFYIYLFYCMRMFVRARMYNMCEWMCVVVCMCVVWLLSVFLVFVAFCVWLFLLDFTILWLNWYYNVLFLQVKSSGPNCIKTLVSNRHLTGMFWPTRFDVTIETIVSIVMSNLIVQN